MQIAKRRCRHLLCCWNDGLKILLFFIFYKMLCSFCHKLNGSGFNSPTHFQHISNKCVKMSNGRGPLIYAALSAVMLEYLQNYDCCVNGILEVSTEKDSRPNLAYSLVGDVLQIGWAPVIARTRLCWTLLRLLQKVSLCGWSLHPHSQDGVLTYEWFVDS